MNTKLRAPMARPEAVSRPRLMGYLDQGLTRKLTLVSAPAGFGKSTLLSQWIALRALPVAWISLDEADNDPVRFLTYLVAALQSVQPGIGREILTTLQSPQPQPQPVEPVLTALVNQLADTSDAVVLVLDDYHLIESRPVHEAVAFLLEYLPPQAHLILSSRADPPLPLPLARLRGRGQLVELRASDLRFTVGEAAEFLHRLSEPELSADAVAALAARTEGWIAGLQMAAVSLHGREDVEGFVRDFTGSNRYILDYLMDEVLRRQPREVQDFLLKTAILGRLSGSLCDAVVGGPHSEPGAQILEKLVRANLFVVPLDEGRHWYRYHRLFADLLQEQLRREWPELVPELHRRASGWFERQGLPAEAIDHALSAEDFERAARLIDQHAEVALGRGEGATLSRWVEALPNDLVRCRPRLALSHAVALFISGRLHEAERRLDEAEAALAPEAGLPGEPSTGDAAPPEDRRAAGERGMIAAIRALTASSRLDPADIIRLAHQALENLPQADSMWRGIATMALGGAWLLKGDWSAARTICEETLTTARRAGNAWLVLASSAGLASIARARGHLRETADYCRRQLKQAEEENGMPAARAAWMYTLSNVLCEQNELESALDYAMRSCELSEPTGSVSILAASYRSLVRGLFARGEMAAAEEAMGRLESLLGSRDLSPMIADYATEWKVRLLLARGELSAAAQLLADRGVTAEGEITIADSASHRSLARLLIAQGKREEAVRLLDRLLEGAKPAGMVRETIETLALRAMALYEWGHPSRALADLERALSLAEPEGYVRILVNEGLPMSILLHEAMAQGIHPEYAGRLLAAFSASCQPSAVSCQPSAVSHQLSAVSHQLSAISHQAPGADDTHHSSLITHRSLAEPLSEREMEVLLLVADGLSNEEITRRLVLALPTVKWHTSNIYGKLGVGSRTQAVAKARALGLLPAS